MFRTPKLLDNFLLAVIITIIGIGAPLSFVMFVINSNHLIPKDFENNRTPITLTHLKALEPKKSEVVGMIAQMSVEAQFDPILSLKVAFCESGYSHLASNPKSSAKGLFMFTKNTWANYCDGEVFNPKDNITCFLAMFKEHPEWWDASKKCWK